MSPVFPSISKKGYGENSNILNEIQKRNQFKRKTGLLWEEFMKIILVEFSTAE